MLVPTIECPRCGEVGEPYKASPNICVDCAKAENSRVAFYRTQNLDWMALAAEAGLEVWERQPTETDREWQVWLYYRDMYPAARPSYKAVAEGLNTTRSAVRKIASRWDFQARLQAWATHVDELIMSKRQQEILAMNEEHITMAQNINAKLMKAIANIDPDGLSPRELQGLLKLSTELERKARVDIPEVYRPKVGDGNGELKNSPTDAGDIKEVLKILQGSGAFGVRQTTEIVVKGDN